MIRPSYVHIINDRLEEAVLGVSDDFPYTSLYVEVDKYVGRCAPWHWHKELEFFYVLKGGVRYHLESGIYDFYEGEGGFVNTNVLHMTTSIREGLEAVHNAQLMDARFISGGYNSVFANKYMVPIMGCQEIGIVKLKPTEPSERTMIQGLQKAHQLELLKEEGYEFEIRHLLSSVWLKLWQGTKEQWQNEHTKSSLDTQRIKDMMSFINTHFEEKLSLKQIAASANISERESFRCFQRCLKMTPFEYLIGRRLQEAADMLKGTDMPIGRICEACGFSTSSYFGKLFKEKMGCTPKSFREEHKDR